jgi:hypothetical protein
MTTISDILGSKCLFKGQTLTDQCKECYGHNYRCENYIPTKKAIIPRELKTLPVDYKDWVRGYSRKGARE